MLMMLRAMCIRRRIHVLLVCARKIAYLIRMKCNVTVRRAGEFNLSVRSGLDDDGE